jgi:hypothetical protein
LDDQERRLDGNAAAGLLAEIFAAEMTVTWGTCAGCGAENQVGAVAAYMHGMGAVLRCPGCDNALVRVGRSAGHRWVDLRGLSCLRLELSP